MVVQTRRIINMLCFHSPGPQQKLGKPGSAARFKPVCAGLAGVTRMGQIGASKRHGSIDQADGGRKGRLGRGECCIASTLH